MLRAGPLSSLCRGCRPLAAAFGDREAGGFLVDERVPVSRDGAPLA